MSPVETFLAAVQAQYASGIAREHAYRPALHDLIAALDDTVNPVNDPARSDVGAPDFIVLKGDVPIGHIEAKDIDIDLRKMKGPNKDQQDRYRKGFENLIYTNCLDWDFYVHGELVASVTIADYLMGLQPKPEAFETLERLLREFITRAPQTITSPDDLARRMAGKAGVIKDVFARTLREDEELRSELAQQYKAFKDNLIHDITPEDFSDIYAETIAYGMFAARLHDPTVETFSRQEAWELIPKTNPFLRQLFLFVAGPDLDKRLRWIIDELARVFLAADLKDRIMKNFGSLTGRADPFLHFYETFLAAYNPDKRKARGVWYTPEAVVNFIVRAVDDVLVDEFGIPDGLADSRKITVDWDTGQTHKGKPVTIKKDVHRVQVLDPATGTGTFLAEVIKLIAPRIQGVAPGMWSQYVEDNLIPRLHGFELLMASYAMCHMKLDMILTELGYVPTGRKSESGADRRLSVYLTNSLEEGEPANQQLPFTRWLSDEAKGANTIKRDMPIMCVIGNPPYNPSSKNENPWISNLMQDYKRGLNERKVNLNDDYMKFIRFAEKLIEENGHGVVAMITNNSFLDGTTQRAMRAHLMKTFDRISVFNLHGDIRAQQADAKDQNVFEITQGVAVTVFTRLNSDRNDCRVYYREITGKAKTKYQLLEQQSELSNSAELFPSEPFFFFVPKSFTDLSENFNLNDFFEVKSSGIQTKNDKVAISWSKDRRDQVAQDFQTLSLEDLERKYPPKSVWKTSSAQMDFLDGSFDLRSISYRPFDKRHTVLTSKSGGFLGRPRFDVMKHIEEGDISLVVNKKHVGADIPQVAYRLP